MPSTTPLDICSRARCQYPTLNVWLMGGTMNMQEGVPAFYLCPAGAHPAHHPRVVRHPGRLVITMMPGR